MVEGSSTKKFNRRKPKRIVSDSLAKTLNCHGLVLITDAKSKLERLFWTSVILISLFGLAYGSYNLSYRLMYFPTGTLITVNYKNDLKLPDVAVCSWKPLNITKLKETGDYSPRLMGLFHWHFTHDNHDQIGSVYTSNLSTLLLNWENVTLPPEMTESWHRFVNDNGFDCESMLKTCTLCFESFNCCANTTPVVNEKLGKCFTLKNLHSRREGLNGGLVLLLAEEQTEDVNALYPPMITPEEGFVVEISDSYVAPYTHGSHHQIHVPLDKVTYVALEQSQLKRIRNCDNDAGIGWSKAACRLTCLNDQVKKFCNCTLLGFQEQQPVDDDVTCDPLTAGRCFERHRGLEFFRRSIFECAEEKCVEPCNEITFKSSVTWSQLKSNLVAKLRMERVKNLRYSKVHIYYPQFAYTVYQEFNLLTFDSIVSNVGGQLGLYLGASIISVIQVLTLFCRPLLSSATGFWKKYGVHSRGNLSRRKYGICDSDLHLDCN